MKVLAMVCLCMAGFVSTHYTEVLSCPTYAWSLLLHVRYGALFALFKAIWIQQQMHTCIPKLA